MSYQYETRRKGWGCLMAGLGLSVGTGIIVAASVPVSKVDPVTGHSLTLLQLLLANAAIAGVAIVALVVVLVIVVAFIRYNNRRAEALEALLLNRPPDQPQVVYIEPPQRPYQPLLPTPTTSSPAANHANALLAQAQEHNRYLQAQNNRLLQKVEDTEQRWSQAHSELADLCRGFMDVIAVSYRLAMAERKLIEEGVNDGARLVRRRDDDRLYLKVDGEYYPAEQYLASDRVIRATLDYQKQVDTVKQLASPVTQAQYKEL